MLRENLWWLESTARFGARRVRGWYRNVRGWQRFWESYTAFKKMSPPEKRPKFRNLHPCIGDDIGETPIDAHYFYQDAWAFEKIVNRRPAWHVDVGSHHKYVSLLSKVVPLTMVDIRPLPTPLDTLKFCEGTIVDLPFEDDTVPSVSSLCVVEHIGLGRYGDPLDPAGSEKAVAELKRIVAPGGYLYLSVPVGDHDIVAFNGERIFSIPYLETLIAPLVITEQRFIVGNTYQQNYEARPRTGTTGLFECAKKA